MASSVNADRIVQRSFLKAMLDGGGKAPRCMRWVIEPGVQSFRVGQGAFGGIGSTLSRTATSASNSDYFTFETSHALDMKVIKHTVPEHTMRSDVGFEQAGADMAAAAIGTLDKIAFDGLEGLFSLAHPRAGAGAGQVGAGKKFLDTALAFLQGEAGAGTQDNLLTSALGEASLNAAIKLLAQQRSDRGVPLNLGTNGGLVLVVDPVNMQLAHELTQSILSGADNHTNFLRGQFADVVVYPLTTDADDWFLVDVANAPVGMVMGTLLTVTMSTTTDGLFVELVAKVECVFFTNPYESGIIGSNVA